MASRKAYMDGKLGALTEDLRMQRQRADRACEQLTKVQAERDEARKYAADLRLREKELDSKLDAAWKARDQAQADAAAMREALTRIPPMLGQDCNCELTTGPVISTALSSNAGAELLERLAKAEALLVDAHRERAEWKSRAEKAEKDLSEIDALLDAGGVPWLESISPHAREMVGLVERVRSFLARLQSAEAERERYREALLKFGEHADFCLAVREAKALSPTAQPTKVHYRCTCGLSAALAPSKPTAPEPLTATNVQAPWDRVNK
jgi:chromosome segregation ATPase